VRDKNLKKRLRRVTALLGALKLALESYRKVRLRGKGGELAARRLVGK